MRKTHKNLDFFRPLQVWSNMSKIHKFRPFSTTVGMLNHMWKNYTRVMNKFLKHLYIKSLEFFRPLQVWSNMSKIHKFRPFSNHCRYGKPHVKKLYKINEQVLGTFVYQNLEFFRPLQVWSKIWQIHKFKPSPPTVGMIYHIRKNYTREMNKNLGIFVHKSLDIFRPLQVWSNIVTNTQI